MLRVQVHMSHSNDKDLSRRDFFKTSAALVGGFIGAAIGIPSIAFLISPSLRKEADSSEIDLGAVDKYPVGIPTLFEFTRTQVNGWERTGVNHGVFVVRPDDKTVRVFSNICTHLGCRVSWHPNLQHYVSPCHDGHFDILGKNVGGPPPRPLDEYQTRIDAGNLLVALPAFRRPA
jgi:menaquinol-cytochrome c reductase iron-sulfur subunit